MSDDFAKYETKKREGATAEQVFRAAARDGQDIITRIRMIRKVYNLSPMQAKEVLLRAEGVSTSLSEHQQRLAEQMTQSPS